MSASVVNSCDRPTGTNRSKLYFLVPPVREGGQVAGLLIPPCGTRNFRTTGVEGAPKLLTGSIMRNVETSYLRLDLFGTGETVRRTVGDAGLRCRKKRRPLCNGVDTGLNVTRPEREQTSDGWFVAGNFVESLSTGKQMNLAQCWMCCLSQAIE